MPNPLAAGDSIAPAPTGQGRKTQRRGGRRLGAKRPERAGPGAKGPGPALLFGAPGAAHRAAPGLPNAAAPGDRPVLSSPPGNRRRAAGAALPRGRGRPPGSRRGGGGVWRQGAHRAPCLPNERAAARPKARAAALSGRFAPPPPPPGTLGSFPPFRTKRLFFRPFSYKQNQRAAPDERPAGIIRWKPGKVIQLVFPRFFQKRQGGGAERRQWRKKRGGSPVSKGVEGSRLGGDAQRPLGTAGAERRQWRKKRGGSPVSKGVEGSRLGGDAQRPLGTAGAERRQWRKKRGGSPVSKGVEGSRLGGDAQRPLRTARGRSPQRGPGQRPGARSRILTH